MLQGKTIILGVTGCIAAYKSATLVSRLKDLGADVWVVMTKEATELVCPLTFRALSGNPVVTNLFSQELAGLPVPHISLAQKADLIVIAPCTANMIGKIAYGIADDPLTTIVMASKAGKLIAPAMNGQMWRNPIVSENVNKLKDLKYLFIGPEEGKLACGDSDIGRMSEPEKIIEKVIGLLGPSTSSGQVGKVELKGKHVLVTAGGTREAIDPVRCLTNRSSGKMGYALAQAARERGATVTLVSAPTNLKAPLDIKLVKVESAGGMLEAVLDHYNNANAVIMAAAVADFRPAVNSKKKIKKLEHRAQNTEHRIELEETPDILKTIAKQKGRKGRILVGFALETDNLIANARKKLKEKDLDLIIANGHKTFDSDSIKFSIIDKKGKVEDYPEQPKDQAAHAILDRVLGLM